jgi:hypothetical protein
VLSQITVVPDATRRAFPLAGRKLDQLPIFQRLCVTALRRWTLSRVGLARSLDDDSRDCHRPPLSARYDGLTLLRLATRLTLSLFDRASLVPGGVAGIDGGTYTLRCEPSYTGLLTRLA